MLMTLATAGRARHMALVSQAEAYTFAFLDKASTEHPEDTFRSVTLIGTPVPDIGELNFLEDEGMPTVILRKLGHDTRVRVMRFADTLATFSDRRGLSFRWSGRWPEAKLERVAP